MIRVPFHLVRVLDLAGSIRLKAVFFEALVDLAPSIGLVGSRLLLGMRSGPYHLVQLLDLALSCIRGFSEPSSALLAWWKSVFFDTLSAHATSPRMICGSLHLVHLLDPALSLGCRLCSLGLCWTQLRLVDWMENLLLLGHSRFMPCPFE